MNRRAFLTGLLATAGGVLVPHEPRRVYSFGPFKPWQLGQPPNAFFNETLGEPFDPPFGYPITRVIRDAPLEDTYRTVAAHRAAGGPMTETVAKAYLHLSRNVPREVVIYKGTALGATVSVLEDALREGPIARMQRRFGLVAQPATGKGSTET